MKWLMNLDNLMPESSVARLARQELMEVDVGKHVQDGKASFHSSWISSDYGLADFRMALFVQNKLYGEEDHPAKIETMLWIAKALQKQNDFEGSMASLQTAFLVQLQYVGLYQPTMVVILDAMIIVLFAMGTPRATDKARAFSNTLHRIKYRLYGKGKTFLDLEAISTHPEECVFDEVSLSLEKEGDHFIIQNREEAVAKYQNSALEEYKKSGSHSLSFALLHRKIAISMLHESVTENLNDPFEKLLRPDCQTRGCKEIRMADKMLFNDTENAAGVYMKVLGCQNTSHRMMPANIQGVLILLLSLIIWFRSMFNQAWTKWPWMKHLDENEKSRPHPVPKDGCMDGSSELQNDSIRSHVRPLIDQGAQRDVGQAFDNTLENQVRKETLSNTVRTIITPHDQSGSTDDNVFATSFESLGTSFMDREIERAKAGHLDSAI